MTRLCGCPWGALVANDEESVVIDAVTTMRRAGASYREIVTAMSDAGLTTRAGGTWNPNQVRRIALRNGIA